MIISFIYDNDYADLKIDLLYKKDVGIEKQPCYHKSVKQLYKYDDITGIIIPGQKQERDRIDFDPLFLLKHIRLLKSELISTLPIYIPNISDFIFENITQVLEIGVQYQFDSVLDIDVKRDKIKVKDLDDIVQTLGNQNDEISRHSLSNEWGAYRLLKQLCIIEDKNDLSFEGVEDSLSESLYFKKLFLSEDKLKEELIEVKLLKNFKTYLNEVPLMAKSVAVIDDKINYGWKDAYSKIFKNIKLDFYDQNETVFFAEFSNRYNLIILDLRLEESVSYDENEILDVKNLSGIILLRKIRAINQGVQIIISTASNKSWSVEAALNYGANGFWTKEDPLRGISDKYRFLNTFNLIKKCRENLLWYNQYKPLLNIFGIIEKAIEDSESNDKHDLKNRIVEKREQFFNQISINRFTFLKEKNDPLKQAFLIIHSLRNDIIDFHIFSRKNQKNNKIIDLFFSKKELFCSRYEYFENGYSKHKYVYKNNELDNFPELKFCETLINYICNEANINISEKLIRVLKKLNAMRNNLDIIHYKKLTDRSKSKSDLNVLLVDLHLYLLIYLIMFTSNLEKNERKLIELADKFLSRK